MQQKRDNVIPVYLLIPNGLTADMFRKAIKMAALQAGMSQQEFLTDSIKDKLATKGANGK